MARVRWIAILNKILGSLRKWLEQTLERDEIVDLKYVGRAIAQVRADMVFSARQRG